jgi:hypothetical protein
MVLAVFGKYRILNNRELADWRRVSPAPVTFSSPEDYADLDHQCHLLPRLQ